ncbi:MAG TPA: VOC family protein [Candidatus Nanoarchaeia archaeon]|nr:VOC family protein [Candidatus Nanoarchaeia archaeon]
MNIKSLIGDYEAFFSDLCTRLKYVSIDVQGMSISHLCYRVTTQLEYEQLRDQIKPLCKAFSERQFNGRAISLLELKEPLTLPDHRYVPLIELPAPRGEHTYPKGLEHVGFVVGESLPKFKIKYKAVLTGEKNRPHTDPAFITFDNGATAKFYERTLKEIVKLQGGQFQQV